MKDEFIEIRNNEKRKRNGNDSRGDHNKKIAALEAKIKEQDQKISLLSTTLPPLPPSPARNPLTPPAGYSKRG